MQDIHSKRVLDPGYYTDTLVLEQERYSIFAKGWASVGLASTVKPGCARPTQLAGSPILLTRTRDGSLHVFHNICAHRGLQLVAEPCEKQRQLTCPYHAWSYDLSGELKGAPYLTGKKASSIPEGAEKSVGLQPIRHAVWFDVVFVNLTEDAPSFSDWIAPLDDQLNPFGSPRLHLISATNYTIEANWKLVCENFLDTYHVPFVHNQAGGPETAINFTDLELSSDIFGFTLPRGDADKKKPEWLFRLPMPPELEHAQFFFYLFPNTLVAITGGWFQVISVQPDRADQSSEILGLYAMDNLTERKPEAAQEFSTIMNRINQQDVEILPLLQAGRRSSAGGKNALAPFWDKTIERFLSRLEKAFLEFPGPSTAHGKKSP